jgi:hypothetical protein
MTNLYRTLIALALTGASCIVGCTAEPGSSEASPVVEDDNLEMSDYGYDYNGWYIDASGTNFSSLGYAEFDIWFTRPSPGDATRGGGGCLVKYDGTSCTTDANCPVSYGNGWGYCVQNKCWQRPGAQATFCGLGRENAPNTGFTRTVDVPLYNTDTYGVLTCLTKTAGPNTACGGTETSLYMRGLRPVSGGS